MRRRKSADSRCAERLESRRLFAVSASTLIFPRTAGTQWATADTDGTTDTFNVLGSAQFNGHNATKIHDVAVHSGGPTVDTTLYTGFDASNDYVAFGAVTVSTDNSQDPPVTSTTTQTLTPGLVEYPAFNVAGQTNTSTTQDHVVFAMTGELTIEYDHKLVSNTLQSVTVPAGTFMCYEFQSTETITPAKGDAEVTTRTDWIAPGVPVVKTIQMNGGSSSTTVLTSWSGAKKTPTKLAFDVQPSDQQVGAVLSPPVTVAVEDKDGGAVSTDTSTVTLAIASGPVGGVMSGTLSVPASGGVATFSNLKFSVNGDYTLRATDGSLTAAVSNKFTISKLSSAKPTKLAFDVQPGTTIAGKAIAPAVTVDVEYSNGTVVITDNSTVTISLASGPGTLGGTLTAKAVNGVATFPSLLLNKVGSYSLMAADGTLTTATSNKFNVTPAAAAKLAFAATPTSTVAGKVITPAVVVDVEDAFGNIVTTNTSNVTVAIATGGGTLGGTATVAAKAGVATFSALTLSKAASHTLKAVDSALTPATSGAFNITAAAAAKLAFAATPANTVAGKPIAPTVVVDVEDAFGNIVTTNTSKVTLSVASGGGVLGGTVAVAAKAGAAAFSTLVLTKTGSYTLKAIDGLLTAATSASFKITPAAPAKLVFAAAPAATVAGKAIKPPVVVDIEDKYGNIVTTDTSKVTMSIATGPVGATLGGTFALAASAGVASFSNLLLTKAGSYTLKAVDGVLTAAISASFNVTAGAPAKLAFVKAPTTGKVSTALLPAILVAIEDSFGNVVTTNASKVTIAIATGPVGAVLGGTLTQTAVKGVATFANVQLNKAGTYTLKVIDGALVPAVSAALKIS